MTEVTATPELLDDLQRKAKAAHPQAEWFRISDLKCHSNVDLPAAKHIAAATPAVVDALVEHIRSLTERLERAEKDAGWISVEDRLPDEHKAEYLCLFGGGDQQVTEWIHDETEGWVFWYGYPTHWRTLPATPSIAQEGQSHE